MKKPRPKNTVGYIIYSNTPCKNCGQMLKESAVKKGYLICNKCHIAKKNINSVSVNFHKEPETEIILDKALTHRSKKFQGKDRPEKLSKYQSKFIY